MLGKQHKEIVPKKSMTMASRQNKLLHTNLCGPFKHSLLGASKYFLLSQMTFQKRHGYFSYVNFLKLLKSSEH
jgi:hypothetical protein